MNEPLISVIIPTYNRKHLLEGCLESVFNQEYPYIKYEVIVVDDGSIDETEVLLKKYAESRVNFSYIKQSNKGPAAARNAGTKKAKGAIMVFTDSDCKLKENFLTNVEKSFLEKPNIAAILGYTIALFRNKRFLELRKYYETKQKGEKPSIVVSPNASFSFHSDCCAVKKEVLRQIGGFDDSLKIPIGEDVELGYRLLSQGFSIYYNPQVVVYHFQRDESLLSFSWRYRIVALGDTMHFAKYFKNTLTVNISGLQICKKGVPVSLFLCGNHFETILLFVIISSLYLPLGIALFILYFLNIYSRVKNLRQFSEFIICHLFKDFGYTLGRIEGSFKYKVIYI
jgi:glycosyltransferase involved in cell wall biosynthesis